MPDLILYATPEGPLAERCDALWAELTTAQGTAAQAYPPHVTLTGFFRRAPERVDDVVADVGRAVGPFHLDALEDVSVAPLCSEDWVGLEVRSLGLHDLTAAVVGAHRAAPGEDALRPKDWLHLSLAYGDGVDVAALAPRCVEAVAGARATGWTVGLWRRDEDGWCRLWARTFPVSVSGGAG